MKRTTKRILWGLGGVALLAVAIWGGIWLKTYLYERFNPPYEHTTITPGPGQCPADTTFRVNGIELRMKGVKAGSICCKDLREPIEIKEFYIAETEVTQQLWTSIMGHNLSEHRGDSLAPVDNVSLADCAEFVRRLNTATGTRFFIPQHPVWLYAALLGQQQAGAPLPADTIAWHKGNAAATTHPVARKHPDALGLYDMFGNVSEWTTSGSDPLFFVAGGSYETAPDALHPDALDVYHAEIRSASTGLRLVFYPELAP